jgi:hypothetical protein
VWHAPLAQSVTMSSTNFSFQNLTWESWERGNPEVQYKNKLDNKVVCKLTLSFTPYPLFQWYMQSKEI